MREHEDAVTAFKTSVYGVQGDEVAFPSGKKRKIEREEDPRVFVAKTDWKELAQNDNLGSLTVDKLKMYLEFHNLPLSGRKGDLIVRIKAHIAIGLSPDG